MLEEQNAELSAQIEDHKKKSQCDTIMRDESLAALKKTEHESSTYKERVIHLQNENAALKARVKLLSRRIGKCTNGVSVAISALRNVMMRKDHDTHTPHADSAIDTNF